MLGSATGCVAASAVGRLLGETFPWGTILVNISRSLLIDALAALTVPGGRFHISSDIRLFLLRGICGGYTTFNLGLAVRPLRAS